MLKPGRVTKQKMKLVLSGCVGASSCEVVSRAIKPEAYRIDLLVVAREVLFKTRCEMFALEVECEYKPRTPCLLRAHRRP